jgi:hypothetical protein
VDKSTEMYKSGAKPASVHYSGGEIVNASCRNPGNAGCPRDTYAKSRISGGRIRHANLMILLTNNDAPSHRTLLAIRNSLRLTMIIIPSRNSDSPALLAFCGTVFNYMGYKTYIGKHTVIIFGQHTNGTIRG